MNINYQKRKNHELFKTLEDPKTLFLSKTQNYIPIYNRFFSLNETNYNNINLNHKWYISSAKEFSEDCENIITCNIKNIHTEKTKEKIVFLKMAPLIDPYKYLVGKLNVDNKELLVLPTITSTTETCNPKLLDVNNAAYVDGFFLYLSSMLLNNYNFCHGLDYYGSFLSIKNNFKLNISDDISYLHESEFFNKHKKEIFNVDDYCRIYSETEKEMKPLLQIDHTTNENMDDFILPIESETEMFNEVFQDNNFSNCPEECKLIDLNELKEMSMNISDITNSQKQMTTLKSNSTCSSRTSHTSNTENEDNYSQYNRDDSNNEIIHTQNFSEENDLELENESEIDVDEDQDEDEDEEIDLTTSTESDEESCFPAIYATIPQIPVHVICMENCEDTFDNLIASTELSQEEWLSALMQIIMILITYQKVFAFTHNDLHTNNVMYNYTDKKYIRYCYKKTYYNVPTFGRIFKIIDFGRSIYKYDNKIFCSDSFQNGGDAATQYNTEPYFNEEKPRLEPNFSFDLCRLACSIFDYLIDDISELKDLETFESYKRIICEWCLDDKGLNMLYKNNGVERYPEFKLYKMIARCVHNHTPQAQLERPEFQKYIHLKCNKSFELVDIDSMRSLV
jgi:hypothetical protein